MGTDVHFVGVIVLQLNGDMLPITNMVSKPATISCRTFVIYNWSHASMFPTIVREKYIVVEGAENIGSSSELFKEHVDRNKTGK